MEKNKIAKKLIIEATEVGPTEMAIRRGNAGIAGNIATVVSYRRKYEENAQGEVVEIDFDQQAAELAEILSEEEFKYAEKNW